jgi:hypothetical protein
MNIASIPYRVEPTRRPMHQAVPGTTCSVRGGLPVHPDPIADAQLRPQRKAEGSLVRKVSVEVMGNSESNGRTVFVDIEQLTGYRDWSLLWRCL